MTLRKTASMFFSSLLAACGARSMGPTELARVSDAPAATEATALTLTAVSVPELRGVGTFSTRNPRAVGVPDAPANQMWVVPLVDPGESIRGPVAAWVTSPQHASAGDSPDPWLERLKRELDGQRVTLKVATRAREAAERGSGWGAAIADAEARFGVKSATEAPVLFFPSP